MKKKFITILKNTITLLLWLPIFSFSQTKTLTVNYSDKIQEQTYSTIIDETLSIYYNHSVDVVSGEINLNIGNSKKYISQSNAQTKTCLITVSYPNEKPILLSSFEHDLSFSIWHEIGHCVLDKSQFTNDINWKIDLSKDKISILNKKIENLTMLSIRSLQDIHCLNKDFKIAPPISVYHEIFSDIFALSLLVKSNNDKNLEEILFLSKKRIEDFNSNPIKNKYASGFAIPYFLDNIENIKIEDDFDLIYKISQNGFLDYINKIQIINE
ncbi:hypothetical protein GW796_07245 [archaeon]|nr:hypothetical protein [archaeon]NCQ51678.1 hypothetical protein [archaeon]